MRLTLIIPEALMSDADHLLAYAGLAGSLGSAALQDVAGQRYALVSEPHGEAIMDAITALLIDEPGISVTAARRAQDVLVVLDPAVHQLALGAGKVIAVMGRDGGEVATMIGLSRA